MTCFEKVPRLLTEPGKGSYWTVNDSMPHAKPSRVRVRKRKAREDDDHTSFGTPVSTSDTFTNEIEVSDVLDESSHRQRNPSYEWPEALPRRRPTFIQHNSGERRATSSIRYVWSLSPC